LQELLVTVREFKQLPQDWRERLSQPVEMPQEKVEDIPEAPACCALCGDEHGSKPCLLATDPERELDWPVEDRFRRESLCSLVAAVLFVALIFTLVVISIAMVSGEPSIQAVVLSAAFVAPLLAIPIALTVVWRVAGVDSYPNSLFEIHDGDHTMVRDLESGLLSRPNFTVRDRMSGISQVLRLNRTAMLYHDQLNVGLQREFRRLMERGYYAGSCARILREEPFIRRVALAFGLVSRDAVIPAHVWPQIVARLLGVPLDPVLRVNNASVGRVRKADNYAKFTDQFVRNSASANIGAGPVLRRHCAVMASTVAMLVFYDSSWAAMVDTHHDEVGSAPTNVTRALVRADYGSK
jgi:hypothetical protein